MSKAKAVGGIGLGLLILEQVLSDKDVLDWIKTSEIINMENLKILWINYLAEGNFWASIWIIFVNVLGLILAARGALFLYKQINYFLGKKEHKSKKKQ